MVFSYTLDVVLLKVVGSSRQFSLQGDVLSQTDKLINIYIHTQYSIPKFIINASLQKLIMGF